MVLTSWHWWEWVKSLGTVPGNQQIPVNGAGNEMLFCGPGAHSQSLYRCISLCPSANDPDHKPWQLQKGLVFC